MKELAGITHPIGMLIEYALSIFSTTNDEICLPTYLPYVDHHVPFSCNERTVPKNLQKFNLFH